MMAGAVPRAYMRSVAASGGGCRIGRAPRLRGRVRPTRSGARIRSAPGFRQLSPGTEIDAHDRNLNTAIDPLSFEGNQTMPGKANGGVSGPLHGLKVIDAGNMIAGPLGATMLADFGADVIKLEQPQIGDSMRHWTPVKEGRSLWWKVLARNKRLITLNLSSKRGQDLFRR